MSPEPVISIGVVEGDPAYQLSGASDATRLSDGTIVVANTGTEELRFYDQRGRHMRTVGGEGEGPGEFDGLQGVDRLANDTLVTWDWNARRLTYLTETGQLVRTVNVPVEGFAVVMIGTLAGVPILRGGFDPMANFARPRGTFRDTVAYLKIDPISGRPDTLLWLAGSERYMFPREGRAFSMRDVPFGAESVIAVADDHVFTGVGDAPEIQIRNDAGAVTRLIRWTPAPEPVTDSDVAAYRAARLEDEDEPAERREEQQMLDELPVAGYLAPYHSAVVDATGALWLEAVEHLPEPETTRWRIFDRDGRYLGIVRLPSALDVIEIGDDWILGHTQDEFDVDYIVLHHLSRTTRTD